MNYVNKLDSKKRKIYFFALSKKNSIKNFFFAKNKNQYLFILSPPFCGSTLLTEILSSSKNVSCNNNIGLKEGQHLPQVHKLLFTEDRWDPNKEIDWIRIKNIWHKYWDRSKEILLEKSPPNICRAENINQVFENSKYICLTRNPYAQIQSNIRRYQTDILDATKKYITYLNFQKDNLEKLENSLLISYEELTDNPNQTKEKIVGFLAELNDININLKFNAHNMLEKKEMGITNLNQKSIDSLSNDQIQSINSILAKEKDLLDFFNYTII
ncbi:MAG: sulfotransferase family protein [Flavobacteriales bacterium]